MSLYTDILATGIDPSRHDEIAAVLSVGRTRVVRTEVGKGAIIEAIGLTAGNALLDVIDSDPTYRHIKQLVENGWFNIGSALARASLDTLVPAVLSEAHADALKALADVPDPVTPLQVARALEQGD